MVGVGGADGESSFISFATCSTIWDTLFKKLSCHLHLHNYWTPSVEQVSLPPTDTEHSFSAQHANATSCTQFVRVMIMLWDSACYKLVVSYRQNLSSVNLRILMNKPVLCSQSPSKKNFESVSKAIPFH